MKSRYLSILIVIPFMISIIPTTHAKKLKKHGIKRITREITMPIDNIGQRYIDFLVKFGSPENSISCSEEMTSLFTSDCKKLINGSMITNDRDALYAQLEQATKDLNGWNMQVNQDSFVINKENNICVIQYDVTTKTLGTMIVMVYLKLDQNGFIKEINEVYNKKS